MRFNLARNVDWIKVLATERAGTPDTDPRKQVYTEAELALIVAEASARGVPVLAHAHGAEGALAAVKAGVRSIEHGTYLTDETLTLMAQRGTFFDPTADVVNDLATPGGDYDNADLQRRGQMMKPVLVDTITRARALGVKIVAGSDTGYGPTSIARISREVIELVEAGLPVLAALQSATTVNADLLKLEQQVGQVRGGLRGRPPRRRRQSARAPSHAARSAARRQQRPGGTRPADLRKMTRPFRDRGADPLRGDAW